MIATDPLFLAEKIKADQMSVSWNMVKQFSIDSHVILWRLRSKLYGQYFKV